MKMNMISVATTWLCATGVAVVSCYCLRTPHKDAPHEQKRVAAAAAKIVKGGTVKEYKAQNRRSSAVRKTTTAKVTTKEVKLPTYVANPIYPSFTNALNRLTAEFTDFAADGDVVLTNGFVLAVTNGMPILRYPAEYVNVGIGGMAIGDELKGGHFDVHREKIPETDQWKVDGVGLSKFKRLDEPEFYCTEVTYSALPATRQIDAIRMHGDLVVGNTSQAQAMVKEIVDWMEREYGAVDQKAAVPAGTLALKKFKIGKGMDVEVRVNWRSRPTDEGCDARIDVNFTTGELVEESLYEREQLGQATDAARLGTLKRTGVDYYTVRAKANADQIKTKAVFCGID